jgi:hypothetical protein
MFYLIETEANEFLILERNSSLTKPVIGGYVYSEEFTKRYATGKILSIIDSSISEKYLNAKYPEYSI